MSSASVTPSTLSNDSNSNIYINPDHRTPNILLAWYWILIVGGQILLPFLLATMILSRNVRRDPTLVNMIITWIIFTVVLCMLYYSGHQHGAEPPFGLCLAQASLLSGAPVMSCAAGLALVMQVFLGLRNLVQKVSTSGRMTPKEDRRYQIDTRWRARAFVIVPYILLVVFTIASVIIGLRNRSSVTRSRAWLFCSIDGPIVTAVSVVSALFSAITLIFEAWIAWIFYRHGTQVASTKTESAFNVRIILRVVAFSGYSGFCWLSFIIIGTKWDIVPWILTSCVPLVAFVIFGSQKSVLRVWAFWIPRTPREELQPTSPLTPSPGSYDPNKPFSELAMAKFTAFKGSKPILVALPPQAHLPTVNDDRKLAPTQSRGSSLDEPDGMVEIPLSKNETAEPLDSPADPRDAYGWEKGYKKAASLGH
ncbi:polysaccharide lyase family 1 protein [Tulasnella calospora MUT 4182]|uniref:Polysaccharide lyase family 1 protein n=1 Tax=Tulasnella calospora MUT 4182 TaxID=1051891 RepID=A0A0C3LUE3_9AGAM|nr:polysaccharide lyase family 1 protein [Tulasnella calospora MUT 4182]